MDKKRKRKLYYTPKHILDYIDGYVINPAAGSGAFLKAAVDALEKSYWMDLTKNPPHSVKRKR
jgi:hypothetical protein